MKNRTLRSALAWLGLFYSTFVGTCAFALPEDVKGSQGEFESDVSAVVRNKKFYKAGRFEITPLVGVMPYDSAVSHFSFGGRVHWHFSDHFGWEVVDVQQMVPTLTSFTTNLARENGISNIQVLKLKQLVSTNFLFSPVYGKFRFIGSSTLHFDLYLTLGVGLANGEVLKISSAGTGQEPTQSVLKTGMDPMFDFGLGAKFFINSAMGLVVDLRDYVVNAQLYNKRSLKSHYSVFVGLSFYLPTF